MPSFLEAYLALHMSSCTECEQKGSWGSSVYEAEEHGPCGLWSAQRIQSHWSLLPLLPCTMHLLYPPTLKKITEHYYYTVFCCMVTLKVHTSFQPTLITYPHPGKSENRQANWFHGFNWEAFDRDTRATQSHETIIKK